MTQRGASCRASAASASAERAGLIVKPSSRAVPATRLVKIRSSDSSRPTGRFGSGVMAPPSDRFRAALAGADADAVLQRQDEDLAVADATLGPGAAGLHDGVHRRLDEVLVDGDLQLHLAEQVHRQLVAAVHLRVALLPAEALDVDDGQAEDLDLVEGLLDGLDRKSTRLNSSHPSISYAVFCL